MTSNPQDMIEAALLDPRVDLEAIDLYQVATILQPLFPQLSISELSRAVAEVAVKSGYTYLVWEPPEHPDCVRGG